MSSLSPMAVLLPALLVTAALAYYNRLLGGIAGLIVTAGMAVWGLNTYEHGGSIALFGAPLDRSAFLAVMGGLALANAIQVVRAVKK